MARLILSLSRNLVNIFIDKKLGPTRPKETGFVDHMFTGVQLRFRVHRSVHKYVDGDTGSGYLPPGELALKQRSPFHKPASD